MTVGERLAKRRQELGWTQVQLAEAAQLTPSAISLFEGNKRKPSFEALRKLAEALRIPTDYLMDDSQRSQATTSTDPRLAQIIQGFTMLDEPGRDQLREYVTQLLARRAGGYTSFDVSADPRVAARELLEKLNLHFPPIDPFLIAALLGVTVRVTPFEEVEFEGILEQQSRPPLMLLAQHNKVSDNRLRFTVAHQMAHLVLQHHRQNRYECRPLSKAAELSMAEKEADAFAAELLVPQSILKKLEPDTREGKLPHPSADQALFIANRCRASIPVSFLQYVRHSSYPCACLLTEGDRIRESVRSTSFPYTLRDRLPEQALCLTTVGQKGVQVRLCSGSEWLEEDRSGAVDLREEAFHYVLSAEQSVTLLALKE